MRTSNLLLISGVLIMADFLASAQTTFTKITTGPVVTDDADGEGCAWIDIDNDGDMDLYVSCDLTGANLLYRNDGGGTFTKVVTGAIHSAGPGSIGAAWADIDNDGWLDLFVSRQNGSPSLLFRHQADGTFLRSSLPAGGFSRGGAWADYDNDGFVDLMVGDMTQNVLWHNNGEGTVVAATDTPIVTTPNGSNLSWADYDNDGDADLFVANSGGTARIYQNKGNGKFTSLENGAFPEQIQGGTGSAWGDFDNDGFLDLFLCRLNPQQAVPSFLFRNNGNGTFTQIIQSPFTDDTGYSVTCVWSDFDNDGWLDLFATDNRGKNRLYFNKKGGTFERVLTGTIANDLGNSAGAASGDYDGDGFLDLFVATGTNGSQGRNDFLYHNDGNSNSWLKVKLIGTASNRSAIGAKVRAKATINGMAIWQMREITTGNGWSQGPFEAHFGLDDATTVETLRVEWPSGTIQEFHNIPSNRYSTLTEPARWIPSKSGPAPQFTLQGGRAREYEIQVSTDLTAWSYLSTLAITNVNGTANISDPSASSSSRRFYRALLR